MEAALFGILDLLRAGASGAAAAAAGAVYCSRQLRTRARCVVVDRPAVNLLTGVRNSCFFGCAGCRRLEK